MMVELICTCGATVSDIMDEYRVWTGQRLLFEKLPPGDRRGQYGSYVIQLTPGQALLMAHRYSSVIRMLDEATPINES